MKEEKITQVLINDLKGRRTVQQSSKQKTKARWEAEHRHQEALQQQQGAEDHRKYQPQPPPTKPVARKRLAPPPGGLGRLRSAASTRYTLKMGRASRQSASPYKGKRWSSKLARSDRASPAIMFCGLRKIRCGPWRCNVGRWRDAAPGRGSVSGGIRPGNILQWLMIGWSSLVGLAETNGHSRGYAVARREQATEQITKGQVTLPLALLTLRELKEE